MSSGEADLEVVVTWRPAEGEFDVSLAYDDPSDRELRASPAMSAYIRMSACMPAINGMTDSGRLRKPH